MEINRIELQTMLRESWLHNQNDIVFSDTVIFLRGCGLDDEDILEWLETDSASLPEITDEDMKRYEENVQETIDYY